MRTRLPALRTLPCRIDATLSRRAISGTGRSRPSNAKLDVRAMTRSSGTLLSTLSSSSEMPSEKYCCSLSVLMFSSGSTAIEGSSSIVGMPVSSATADADVDAVSEATVCHSQPAPMATTARISTTSRRVTFCTPRSPWYHATISVTKNPSTASATPTRLGMADQP